MNCVAQNPTDDPLLGRCLGGKFAIESFLCAGAMGAIYRARHLSLDKTICVKVLHPVLATNPRFAQRFHREAKAASRLDHPNSVRIIDFGEEPDGLLYIAMEYLQGSELLDVIERSFPLAPERVVSIVSQVLAALAVAHENGILHRDLKPENIMIVPTYSDDGSVSELVKVCDFGIAKISAPDLPTDGLTTGGMIVGTPEYMSPEQVRGEAIDARSDLYSVGVLLYYMLAGRRPFESESAVGVVLKHMNELPKAPSKLVPDVDPALEAVCMRALAKDPNERFDSAREMRAALQATTFEVVLPLQQRAASGIQRKFPEPKPERRPPWGRAALVTFFVLVGLFAPWLDGCR
jgi:serine/threonine-protein kinase